MVSARATNVTADANDDATSIVTVNANAACAGSDLVVPLLATTTWQSSSGMTKAAAQAAWTAAGFTGSFTSWNGTQTTRSSLRGPWPTLVGPYVNDDGHLGGHTMSRRRTRSRGQALVEFALVFPVLALVLFGLIDVGRLVYVYNAVSQGAREGARYGSVADYASSCNLGRDACVVREVKGRMTAVPASTVTVACERQEGSGTTVIADADQCKANDFLVVRVDTPVTMVTPVISGVIGTVNIRGEARVIVNS